MKVERERRGAPCYRGILLCHDIVRYVGQFIPCYTLPLAMPCVPISCCVGRLGTSRGMGNLRMKTAAEPGTFIAVGMYASHCISYPYFKCYGHDGQHPSNYPFVAKYCVSLTVAMHCHAPFVSVL